MSPLVLFDNNYDDGPSYLFEACTDIITAEKLGDVPGALARIAAASKNNQYAAGYINYEAAAAINPHLETCPPAADAPLLQFGLFDHRCAISEAEIQALLDTDKTAQYSLTKPKLNRSQDTYARDFKALRAHLEAGETYQTNYTLRSEFEIKGSLERLYADLRLSQPVAYGAFLRFGPRAILSRSPELFFQKCGNRLWTKPMKGTAARSDALDQDALTLGNDEKTRAEHMIIVDLLRNDLCQIARPGSVEVEQLMTLEAYRSVYQITSTISCQIPETLGFEQALAALFPCGSVTGAPKVRTMQIIKQLEGTPRGVYTGAIGYITPENDMCFSVPIRTVEVAENGSASLGLGGGVTYDSEAGAEYDECLVKGRFLFDLDGHTDRSPADHHD